MRPIGELTSASFFPAWHMVPRPWRSCLLRAERKMMARARIPGPIDQEDWKKQRDSYAFGNPPTTPDAI